MRFISSFAEEAGLVESKAPRHYICFVLGYNSMYSLWPRERKSCVSSDETSLHALHPTPLLLIFECIDGFLFFLIKCHIEHDKQAAMEILLRTSGAGRSWRNPTVFFKIATTPRAWKGACETGEGVQGALWPLLLNLVSMVRKVLGHFLLLLLKTLHYILNGGCSHFGFLFFSILYSTNCEATHLGFQFCLPASERSDLNVCVIVTQK